MREGKGVGAGVPSAFEGLLLLDVLTHDLERFPWSGIEVALSVSRWELAFSA